VEEVAESVSSVERVDTWPETAPTHLKVYITQWVREYKQGWMDSLLRSTIYLEK